jgi:hypothetical protein
MPLGYHRIYYNDFHNHWSDWGRNRYWYNQDWYREHSRQHWAGHEFHRPPPGHPGGVRGPQDKGPRGDVKSVDKGPNGKPVVAGYNEKGSRSDAGPGIKGRKYGEDKGTPGKERGGKGKQGHPSKTD